MGHISVSFPSNKMWQLVLDSYKLVVFIGMKGAGSGEEGEGESKVIRVGVLFIISCFPYVLVSGLLSECDIIPHGEEAWQVISHILVIKLWHL